jgi:hypothetical protein
VPEISCCEENEIFILATLENILNLKGLSVDKPFFILRRNSVLIDPVKV